MSENTNELAVIDEATSSVRTEIASLASGTPSMYVSIQGTDFATRAAILNAITNSVPLSENIGRPLNIKDVIVQAIDMPNEQTGVISAQPRIVLIDADGTAYHAISDGLWRAVQNILGVMGQPHTWPEPLPVYAERVKAARGFYFTLKVGVPPKPGK